MKPLYPQRETNYLLIPRPNKAIPQSERTRFVLVHDLPPEGRDDGVTSVRFEVPADGIIDDLKTGHK